MGLVAVSLAFAGCVHELRPLEIPLVEISPSAQAFPRGAAVALVNEREGEAVISIRRDGVHRFTIDPGAWTEAFRLALARELERRGVRAVNGAAVWGLAVDLEPQPTDERGPPRVTVRVRIGDWERSYPRLARDGKPRRLKDALQAAMQELLEDPELRRRA